MTSSPLPAVQKERDDLPFVLGTPPPQAVTKETALLDDDKWWMLVTGENDAGPVLECRADSARDWARWRPVHTSGESVAWIGGASRGNSLDSAVTAHLVPLESAPDHKASWYWLNPKAVNTRALSFHDHKLWLYDTSRRENQLHALMYACGGYLTRQEADARGFASVHFTRLVREGKIERTSRGVYRDLGAPLGLGVAESLLELQLRVPWARPALATALELHGLTTTVNSVYHVAIPHNRTLPELALRVEPAYFSAASYDHGLEEIKVGGRTLVTYSAAKTVADLLKYSGRYGRELYLEGLKTFLKRGGSRGALLEAAKVNHVLGELRRDLEVLFHDV